MQRFLKYILAALLFASTVVATAQSIKDASYLTVGHVREDGTVMDSSYRTVGHAKGIPLQWAAFYFFFHE